MKKTMEDVYQYIKSHQKKGATPDETKEIVRIVVDMLLTEQDLYQTLLVDYARNRKGKLMKKKAGAK